MADAEEEKEKEERKRDNTKILQPQHRGWGKIEVFGHVRTHSDPSGPIGMHSDAFGSIWKHLDVFETFGMLQSFFNDSGRNL